MTGLIQNWLETSDKRFRPEKLRRTNNAIGVAVCLELIHRTQNLENMETLKVWILILAKNMNTKYPRPYSRISRMPLRCTRIRAECLVD